LAGPPGTRQFFTINAGAQVTINGHLLGNTGVELSKDGPGKLILAANNSGFTGPISVGEGILDVRNALALGDTSSPTTVLSDSTTGKTGQLQVENATGAIAEPLFLNGPGPANDGALLNLAGGNVRTGPIQLDRHVP